MITFLRSASPPKLGGVRGGLIRLLKNFKICVSLAFRFY